MEADPPFVKEIDAKAANGDEGCKAAAKCVQAMRSVICANHCPVSATAYFAAVVAALQRHTEHQDAASEGATASALLLVLRKALPAVSESVVQARFNDIAAALTAVLKAPGDEGLVRQALVCMSVASDMTYNAGARPNRKILKPLLGFLGDQRVPVRHQAELSATQIIKRAASASDQQTMDFASQHLAQMIASARPDKKAASENPAQQAMALVRAVAPLLPLENLGSICAELLRLPATLGQHPCCTEAFEFLAAHLGRKTSGDGEADQAAALAIKLFPGLLGVPVTLLNVGYVVAYAQTLAACASLLSSQRAVAGAPPDVHRFKLTAMKKLVALFKERDPTLLRGARDASLGVIRAAGDGGGVALLEELPELCRPLLGYEAKGAWHHALPVVAGLFRAFDAVRTKLSPAEIPEWTRARFERVRALLRDLVDIRDKAMGRELNSFGKELSECIGSAVAAFGPELVLGVAELQLLQHSLGDQAYEQRSRSWMLLVLGEHCHRTSLAFFASHFLPLASTVRGRMVEAETAMPIHWKKYEAMLDQIWALLPGFCDEPLDLGPAMLAEGGRLAKQMVSVLLNERQLREHVWLAFTRACNAAREPPSALALALRDANLSCLRTLSGRVLPEMFNAYVKVHAESEGQDTATAGHTRQGALAAVQSYVRIAEPAQVGGHFKTLVARMLKATTAEAGAMAAAEQAQAVPVAELAAALVPHLAVEFLELALKVFAPMLNRVETAEEDDKGHAASLQKTAYRAVAAVMQHDAAGKIGDANRILELWPMLRDARQTCTTPAVKARLAAIQALLLLMQERLANRFREPAIRQGYIECLKTVLPEIMQHLRDPGSALRDVARECLHVAATTAIHQDLQAEIVTLISAGLAGLTRLSKASAVDTFSRLMYEHSTVLSEELQGRLTTVVLLLLEDNDAQVWRSALKFAKVVAFVAPKERLTAVLPQIFRLFQSRHLASAKMLVRTIIERLAKVLPAELLAQEFPKEHLPLLHYVQKQIARQQRPKTMREAKSKDEDGGDEDAEMEDAEGAPKASWDAFDKEEDGDVGAEAAAAPRGARRKRARGSADGAEEAAKERPCAPPPSHPIMAHDAVQALLDAWEAEGGSDDEGGGRRGRGKRKRDGTDTSTWIHEDKDVPLDFMSADAAHSVLTVRPPQLKRQRAGESGEAGAQNRVEALRRSGLRFAEDGRLIVSEEAAEAEDGKQGKRMFEPGDTKKVTPLSRLAEMRKKRTEAKAKARLAKSGHFIQGLDQFKPKKKAAGDMKRKGAPLNPYAYVKLNPKNVKEKFKDKSTATFARIIKGAKKGVLRGKKAKMHDAKKKQAAETRKSRRGKKPHKPGAR